MRAAAFFAVAPCHNISGGNLPHIKNPAAYDQIDQTHQGHLDGIRSRSFPEVEVAYISNHCGAAAKVEKSVPAMMNHGIFAPPMAKSLECFVAAATVQRDCSYQPYIDQYDAYFNRCCHKFPHSFSFGKIPQCHIVNITPISISFIPARQNE